MIKSNHSAGQGKGGRVTGEHYNIEWYSVQGQSIFLHKHQLKWTWSNVMVNFF